MFRDYRIYEYDADFFERLCAHICIKILGEGFIHFAKGPDGGCDGIFAGKANCFPSESSPLEGKIIVQAKHTKNPIASFSDSGFLGKSGSVLGKEIIRVKNLLDLNQIDHYILFANRKLSSGAEVKIRQKFLDELNLSSCFIWGTERIYSFLDENHKIVKDIGLNKFRTPLCITPQDLKEVISVFKGVWDLKKNEIESKYDFTYVNINKKNEINGLSFDYFNYIRENSENYFSKIDRFLKDPINASLSEIYYDTADELKGQLVAKRNYFDTFDWVIENIYEIAIEDELLKKHKRLTRIFLHFMYCNCDIGKKC